MISYYIVSFLTVTGGTFLFYAVNIPVLPLPERSLKTAEKRSFYIFLKFYLHYSYWAQKDQHFNRKKTRENLLSEGT
jgi:hypothetical protein